MLAFCGAGGRSKAVAAATDGKLSNICSSVVSRRAGERLALKRNGQDPPALWPVTLRPWTVAPLGR